MNRSVPSFMNIYHQISNDDNSASDLDSFHDYRKHEKALNIYRTKSPESTIWLSCDNNQLSNYAYNCTVRPQLLAM